MAPRLAVSGWMAWSAPSAPMAWARSIAATDLALALKAIGTDAARAIDELAVRLRGMLLALLR